MGAIDRSHRPTAEEQSLFAALRDALEDLPHGHDEPYRAGALLVKHYDDRELLGLIDEGQRAVYYSGLIRCIAAAPFDATQVHIDKARPLAQTIDDPESWLAVTDQHFDWVNPKYR